MVGNDIYLIGLRVLVDNKDARRCNVIVSEGCGRIGCKIDTTAVGGVVIVGDREVKASRADMRSLRQWPIK